MEPIPSQNEEGILVHTSGGPRYDTSSTTKESRTEGILALLVIEVVWSKPSKPPQSMMEVDPPRPIQVRIRTVDTDLTARELDIMPRSNAKTAMIGNVIHDRSSTGTITIPIKGKGVLNDRLVRVPEPERKRILLKASADHGVLPSILQVQIPLTVDRSLEPSCNTEPTVSKDRERTLPTTIATP